MAVGVRDAFTGTSSADTFTVEADTTFSSSAVAVNRYTGERVSVAGYNRSYDTYDLGGAADTLAGSAGNDAFFFSTAGSARTDANGASVASSAHFTSVNIFVLGQGGDLLDLTAGSGGADSYATGVTAYGDSSGPVGSGAFGADVLWAGRAPTPSTATPTPPRGRPPAATTAWKAARPATRCGATRSPCRARPRAGTTRSRAGPGTTRSAATPPTCSIPRPAATT
jgi:hypothetical protein